MIPPVAPECGQGVLVKNGGKGYCKTAKNSKRRRGVKSRFKFGNDDP